MLINQREIEPRSIIWTKARASTVLVSETEKIGKETHEVRKAIAQAGTEARNILPRKSSRGGCSQQRRIE